MKRMHQLKPVLSTMAALVIALAYIQTSVRAQAESQAAIVVVAGDGTVHERCVGFEDEELSGLDLIKGSGLEMELDARGLGSAICRIESVGCPANDCFCECGGMGECIYWSYWHLEGKDWLYSNAGASSYKVRHGAVDGWTWGPGSISSAIEPPQITFAEICSNGVDHVVLPADADAVDGFPVIGLVVLAMVVGALGFGLVKFRGSSQS